jgi:hypothetical protein
VASGNLRDHSPAEQAWTSPQKSNLSLLQQKALQFKNKLINAGSTPNLIGEPRNGSPEDKI